MLELIPSGRAVATVQIKWQMAPNLSRVGKDVSKTLQLCPFGSYLNGFLRAFLLGAKKCQEAEMFPQYETAARHKGTEAAVWFADR